MIDGFHSASTQLRRHCPGPSPFKSRAAQKSAQNWEPTLKKSADDPPGDRRRVTGGSLEGHGLLSHRSSFALLNAASALSDPRVALSNLRFAILGVSGGFPGQICSCFLSEAKTEWRAGRPDFPVFLTEFNHFMRDESGTRNRKLGDTPTQFLAENRHAAAPLPWTNRRSLRISRQFCVVFVSLTA